MRVELIADQQAVSLRMTQVRSWIIAGQSLRVGRSTGDLINPGDSLMSARHFELQCDGERCLLRDTNSRHGTLLNGQRVTEASLEDGDEIKAGGTTFKVRIEGAVAAPRFVAQPQAPKSKASFSVGVAASGVPLLRGSNSTPATIANIMIELAPLYLLVDFNRLERPLPEAVQTEDFLFDWPPPAALPLCSPVLIEAAQAGDWPALVDAAWGEDALTCLASPLEKGALLAHLRDLIHGKEQADQKQSKGSMVGACWPGVLAELLLHRPAPATTFMLEGITAVLIEAPPPWKWQVFGGAGLQPLLEREGLARSDAAAPGREVA